MLARLLIVLDGAWVTGLDPAPRLHEVACEQINVRGLVGRFHQGDAANLPSAAGSADAVVSSFGRPWPGRPPHAEAQIHTEAGMHTQAAIHAHSRYLARANGHTRGGQVHPGRHLPQADEHTHTTTHPGGRALRASTHSEANRQTPRDR
ncbi:class I SAM-dependent methyltransferase [Kineosporia sp. NBRC 101677]|uniref:class I SAM-dependent methyltransferase n=1 Tax=Kineosporia sp. NBRC 101677 TaxID=3032197 RepID=UPI00331D74CB